MKPHLGKLGRIVASSHRLEAEQLQDDAARMSCTPLEDLRRGSMAMVTGRLRAVSYTPRETLPTLEAELFDGSGSIELVWLGRRRIARVEAGRRIRSGERRVGKEGRARVAP